MPQGMQYVAPPPPLAGRAGSLLAAAHTPADALTRADLTGYVATTGGGWTLYAACSPDRVDRTTDVAHLVQAWPFVIDAQEECSTFGVDDLRARATARLAVVESTAIARELWTGELATAAGNTENPRLQAGADVIDVTPTGGPVRGKQAIGLLEQALAGALDGEPGVLHVAPIGLPFLPDLTRTGDLLTTRLDTRVIADAGYPGTGPTGAANAAGVTWVYATARPSVRRGPVTITDPASGRTARDNTLTYTAQRDAWVAFPGAVFAVRLTINEGA